jgi:hypothetical protein
MRRLRRTAETVEHRVDLRLSQLEILEKVHQQADFVERQADHRFVEWTATGRRTR